MACPPGCHRRCCRRSLTTLPHPGAPTPAAAAGWHRCRCRWMRGGHAADGTTVLSAPAPAAWRRRWLPSARRGGPGAAPHAGPCRGETPLAQAAPLGALPLLPARSLRRALAAAQQMMINQKGAEHVSGTAQLKCAATFSRHRRGATLHGDPACTACRCRQCLAPLLLAPAAPLPFSLVPTPAQHRCAVCRLRHAVHAAACWMVQPQAARLDLRRQHNHNVSSQTF